MAFHDRNHEKLNFKHELNKHIYSSINNHFTSFGLSTVYRCLLRTIVLFYFYLRFGYLIHFILRVRRPKSQVINISIGFSLPILTEPKRTQCITLIKIKYKSWKCVI